MGNPAWGHGYHRGFSDGARQGGITGSLVVLGVGAVITGGVWAVGKLRNRSAAKTAALDLADAQQSATPWGDNPEDSTTSGTE